MAGMPDIGGMGASPGGFGGLPGGMMPGGASGMAGQGSNSFGNTRGMMPGRYVDIALFTRTRPAGTEGTQAIPPGVQLGPSLPLVPPVRERTSSPSRSERADAEMQQPKGRLLLYWGCGEQVRAVLPPAERRCLVLIDPPYENPDAEFERSLQVMKLILERLANAVVALWYPIKDEIGRAHV